MIGPVDEFHPDAGQPDATLSEERLLQELTTPVECPDFTRNVMGRLGYMSAAPAVVARRRRHRWAQRGVLAMSAMIALFVGINVYNQSTEARTPRGPVIDEAFSSDVENHQQRLGAVIQSIRNVLPPSALIQPDSGENPVKGSVEPNPSSNVQEEELPREACAFPRS